MKLLTEDKELVQWVSREIFEAGEYGQTIRDITAKHIIARVQLAAHQEEKDK